MCVCVQVFQNCLFIQGFPTKILQTSSFVDPNTFLRILFSKTLSLYMNFQNHIKTGFLLIQCALIYIFLDAKIEDKHSEPNEAEVPRI
jgi:hypothetical protein